MKYQFTEIFDIPTLTRLCQSFSNIRGVGLALLDLEGNIHIACEWKEVCTDFHRANPESTKRCAESDTELANQLSEGSPYNLYHCKNGLVDVAVPIKVDGEHVGNLFTGQFLEKEPDTVFFRAQADHFGFPVDEYLGALSRVPIQSEEETKRIVTFLVELAQVMGEMGLEKLRSLERDERIRQVLEEKVKERTRTLNHHSEQLRIIGQMQADFISETDPEFMYRKVLQSLQALSSSPYGLIAEIVSTQESQNCLRVYSLSGIAVDPGAHRRHGDEANSGLTARKLDRLVRNVIRSKETVIYNRLSEDGASHVVPEVGEKLTVSSFLGIPVIYGDRLVGVICLLNRDSGYDNKHLVYYQPVASTCAQIIAARCEREKRKRAEKELEMLATQDALTKIANRHSFNQFIGDQWCELQSKQLPVAIIMIDIDSFKNYNDYYGHQAGDDCLEKVASVLKEVALRPTDIAARYGGEEFVVVLSDTFVAGAVKVAHTIIKRLDDLAIPHMDSNIAPYVTLSIGVVDCIPSRKMSPEDIIAVADECLYDAKKRGRNQVVCKSLIQSKSAQS